MTTLVSSPPGLNPYVGPRPFERGQRLYGRDREVARLRDLLIAERIVLLYSPSGAGKTSLIRAGLVPELEREGFRVAPEIRVGAELAPVGGAQPSNRYLMSALLCLEKSLPAQRRRGPAELAGMGLADYLDGLDGERDGDVLIFDQFEELLVADPTDQDAKAAFLTELGVALRDRRRWAVFAMREDLVAGLDPYLRLLPTRLRTTFRLDLLGEAAARVAIQRPARDAGVDFSDAAARKLVDSLRQMRVRRSGALVEALGPHVEPMQLQVVCERLWERLGADAVRITEADVEEVGDVDSALAGYYAGKVETVALQTGVNERTVRDWFQQVLITEQGVRVPALTGPLDGETGDEQVLWQLENAHLVRVEARGGARWFELAHDRLIGPVRTSNAEWRVAHLQPFQRQAPLWQREFQPDHLLLAGDALAEADRWVARHPGRIEPLERRFLAASHVRQRRARSRWLRIVASIVATVLTVLAAAAFYVATSRSYSLAYESMAMLEADPARALQMALEAVRWPPRTPQAQRALTNALAASHVRAILSLGQDSPAVTRADVSPDGQLVVTVSDDGIARTWSATTGVLMTSFGAQVSMARFSPRGSRVVTASMDGTARVWDVVTGSELWVLGGHVNGVVSAQWSPDGSRIVTAGLDNTVRVWDAGTGGGLAQLIWPQGAVSTAVFAEGEHVVAAAEASGPAYLWEWRAASSSPMLLTGSAPVPSPDGRYFLTVVGQALRVWDARGGTITQLSGHEARVTAAGFSPDGAHIVSGSEDGRVRIWEVATGATLVELLGHRGPVSDVAFSPTQPDPLRLTVMTASADGTARVWNPQIGKALDGDAAGLSHASFSADGTLVVGAGVDGVARVWRAETGQLLAELRALVPQPLSSAAFSPDGRYLVTGGADRVARIWEWGVGKELGAISPPGGSQITAAVFDPTGALVVIAGTDENAYLWDWRTPAPLRPLRGHEAIVTDAAFSPDGTRIVTASLDETARVWDSGTGAQLQTLQAHTEPVHSADFSPDGRLIVTTSSDRTARIWDATTGRGLRPLIGHQSGLRDAAFSPDGSHVVTGAADGAIGIWEAGTGSELALLRTPSRSVTSVRFSPARLFLFTAGENGGGIARIYDCEICAPLSDLRTLAQDRLRAVQGQGPYP
ncbi:MAG: hypothetical protein ACRD0K_09915 [Egibacteraceae bacterium]